MTEAAAMTNATALADWTEGAEAVLYQSCDACRHVWYFRRAFCPSCGAQEPQTRRASGSGEVYAATIVCRAATPEAKAHVPYAIVLVDMEEGFRMMAHGDNELVIGDKIVTQFRPFAGVLAPHVVKKT
ncbi:Zn-ribbon domain-containing OB-fold protein [Bradyrhizobium sp. SYSU BS000235]|uniref:Zn-ribbon domain-containing OB-fold protein n=1 Tax=Bradyrhizobium sp. SYSU BS000235 TaxID=3411332 RepID=UPI003C73E2A0